MTTDGLRSLLKEFRDFVVQNVWQWNSITASGESTNHHNKIWQRVAEAIEADDWFSIDTAPKDGTPILIARPTEFETEEGFHVVRWDDSWWQVHDGKFDTPLRGSEPTHWMPLRRPANLETPRDDAE